MAGSSNSDSDPLNPKDSLFVWDETSHLYFHASSGFYHDPNAGWYYSSRDGLYYKFEDGNYVPLDSRNEVDKPEASGIELCGEESSFLDEQNAKSVSIADNCSLFNGDQSGIAERINDSSPENPRPPSEWLEDTLINLYLSGYSNQAIDGVDYGTRSLKTNDVDNSEGQADGEAESSELEEGEWIPEDDFDVTQASENMMDEGLSWEEESWRAQYGQVVQPAEEAIPEVPAVDLWDWSMVKGPRKDGKGEIFRLVGRLMKKSAKLHPSMPSGGGLLRTAPIREVHLDLVRVSTGQIYKLRNPSAKFLASLSAYDSSNPTRDWGFPELSLQEQPLSLSKYNGKIEPNTAGEDSVANNLTPLQDQPLTLEKKRSNVYRDRAAERRALHGGFSVAPGQKSSALDDHHGSPSISTEEAAAEALNMSFGSNSYARRILEGMGWKEGEALGKTNKGLIEPIQAGGNIGNAGIGWPQGRLKHL